MEMVPDFMFAKYIYLYRFDCILGRAWRRCNRRFRGRHTFSRILSNNTRAFRLHFVDTIFLLHHVKPSFLSLGKIDSSSILNSLCVCVNSTFMLRVKHAFEVRWRVWNVKTNSRFGGHNEWLSSAGCIAEHTYNIDSRESLLCSNFELIPISQHYREWLFDVFTIKSEIFSSGKHNTLVGSHELGQ